MSKLRRARQMCRARKTPISISPVKKMKSHGSPRTMVLMSTFPTASEPARLTMRTFLSTTTAHSTRETAKASSSAGALTRQHTHIHATTISKQSARHLTVTTTTPPAPQTYETSSRSQVPACTHNRLCQQLPTAHTSTPQTATSSRSSSATHRSTPSPTSTTSLNSCTGLPSA